MELGAVGFGRCAASGWKFARFRNGIPGKHVGGVAAFEILTLPMVVNTAAAAKPETLNLQGSKLKILNPSTFNPYTLKSQTPEL